MKSEMVPFRTSLSLILCLLAIAMSGQKAAGQHNFNSYYSGKNLDYIAFPLGGIGAGMVCLDGNGAWSHLSIDNQPDVFNEPFAFAAISVSGIANGAKVLQGQIPTWKIFGRPGTANGGGDYDYGLPRFENCRFLARFPFGLIELDDKDIPLKVKISGWSPFIPGDADNSSLPVGSMEYTFTNTSDKTLDAVFSWNSKNIIRKDARNEILPTKNGFILHQKGTKEKPEMEGWFSVFTEQDALIDHSWFRGGWFDALTILWKDIREGMIKPDEPSGDNPPGASLFVPLHILPKQEQTVRLMFCWYSPNTKISSGSQPNPTGAAFGDKPAPGAAASQQDIPGFVGKQLVNTYYPDGDGLTGTLTSPEFKIKKRLIAFLIGGGGTLEKTGVNLKVGGKIVRSASGKNQEQLTPVVWDVKEFKGKTAILEIIDNETGGWGHVNADQIIFSDNPLVDPASMSSGDVLFEDFEGTTYGSWKKSALADGCAGCDPEACTVERYYKPWYAGKFDGIASLQDYWILNYSKLKSGSEIFRDAFYSSTLAPEVLEAIGANLTILKSPTVLRDTNGKLWAWEGCDDNNGCCAGSCTHVWNYAQAIPHLFPELERSLRATEFTVSQNAEGHQTFRANLPINEPQHKFHAASDGQLGGIMKVYREWRISGDNDWLSNIYPFVRQSLDYCIKTWDPDKLGVLVEPHHNTYDIEFWGPDGMCSSFYLGALTAFIEMSRFMQKPVPEYESLLVKGKSFMEQNLFNGEYFFQKIRWNDLHAADPTKIPAATIAPNEAYDLLVKEGPKYQYGSGCISDGIMGMWMASCAGLPEIIDNDKVTGHLSSVYKYNFKSDLTDHDNPQRPTYALGKEGGLILCTWPKGGQLSLPFVYSNEVWTGIEYQVASHLMIKGEVQKGLDIVKACRDRYDGTVRNPFDEYECGHWYARALSSYGMLQGLTGIRYDAVDKVLFINTKVGDNFTSFISTETGFGNAGLKNGVPFVEVKMGKIPYERIVLN
ncbi:MAG: GH116 family glycosyl hydrolase [Bacteroidales bacterium]|jgi:uncharacterized protein (DUF608 family)